MFAHRVPPWVTIAVISCGGLVSAMQFTLIIPLIADLPGLLDISSEDASWLITATILCSAVSTPIVARMADMYGKRRMLMVVLTVMVIGSVICALEGSFAMLILGRAMQGFAASLIAVGISILRDELPKERVGTAVALMSATMGIGSGLGLPLSGVLYQHLGWHSIFWSSAIAGLVLVIAIALFIDESSVRTPGRFDILGAILFSIAIVALLLPLTKAGQWGWDSPLVLGLLGLSALTLVIWFPTQLRRSQPMVDLRIARQRTVLTTNIASLFVGFAMFANMLLTTQILQLPTASGAGLGLDAGTAGLAMIPMGLVMAVMAPITGRLLDRIGGRLTLILGSGIMAIGYAARVPLSESVLQVIIGSTVVGAGTAIAFASLPALIMSAVPITETASANGLNTLVRTLGSSIASAGCAAILAASVAEVGGTLLPTRAGTDAVAWTSAAVAAIAVLLALAIPAARPATPAARGSEAQGQEIVVRGEVVFPGSGRERPSLVSVLTLDGDQVDWSPTGPDRCYSVVLPGAGTYVFTVNALGWSPASRVVDYDGHGPGPMLRLGEELTLHGRVTHEGEPCSDATVALAHGTGGLVQTTTCDEHGRYRVPLPGAGPYVVTAIRPSSRDAAARKLVIGVESIRFDIELAPATTEMATDR
ncbi:hypothetical protein BHE97_10405 [Aeromicrobium sp. PE09-221]|uniref:MFS transporter n=1 Tax=Aeromicrobium sp. PE09-221 TaxID=1898043 RepID=UPI000B68A3B8|nr:MFS transporter [Aeromicrobium sp. PE09-221]OUZ09460.1 hypothetical protein BHE97_10405 [Aeromicrobium sp. PE09-221]